MAVPHEKINGMTFFFNFIFRLFFAFTSGVKLQNLIAIRSCLIRINFGGFELNRGRLGYPPLPISPFPITSAHVRLSRSRALWNVQKLKCINPTSHGQARATRPGTRFSPCTRVARRRLTFRKIESRNRITRREHCIFFFLFVRVRWPTPENRQDGRLVAGRILDPRRIARGEQRRRPEYRLIWSYDDGLRDSLLQSCEYDFIFCLFIIIVFLSLNAIILPSIAFPLNDAFGRQS